MGNVLAIANANAGSTEQEAIDAAVRVLRASGSVEVAGTTSAADLQRALRAHADAQEVVVLGGDGSLHAVVSALRTLDLLGTVRLGLVPMGTGNDFARSAGIPDDPAAAARLLLAAEPRDVDLLVDDEDGIVVNAAHIGIGAEAGVAARPWKTVLGPVGYAVGTAISGLTRRGFDLEVRVDDRPVRPHRPDGSHRRVLQVAVGNATHVGGGAPLLPDADPTDGLLDVAVSYANALPRRLTYVMHLRAGEHTERDDVVVTRGARVEVSGEPFRCMADGESSRLVGGRTWHVEAGAVAMRLPDRQGAFGADPPTSCS